MTTQTQTVENKAVSLSLNILKFLLGDYHPRNFTVQLWDGSEWPAESGSPQATIFLKHPGTLRRMMRSVTTDLYVGEAYIFDDFDLEGDIAALFPVVDYLLNLDWSFPKKLHLSWMVHQLPKSEVSLLRTGKKAAQLSGNPHSLERDRQAIAYHYNVSNDFYALWLDEGMVYSCAYFNAPDETLDIAQKRKLDYICRKLRLRPAERLLDIGCGWGGLILHAAQHYGVEALGITLSQPQADLANERIRQAGLSDRCRVEVRDYREVEQAGQFDKLVSVGMFEHVGEALLPLYFQQAARLLRPGGLFLNHGIARRVAASPPTTSAFIRRYVFPDGELVPINVTLRHAEAAGFEVRDVENLREHYALTLHQWVRRLEAQHQKILQVVDEPTYRIWRLFMAASAYSFEVEWIHVYQSLLVKPDEGKSYLPLTRADWYAT